MTKKIVSLILAIVIMFTVVPINKTLAEENYEDVYLDNNYKEPMVIDDPANYNYFLYFLNNYDFAQTKEVYTNVENYSLAFNAVFSGSLLLVNPNGKDLEFDGYYKVYTETLKAAQDGGDNYHGTFYSRDKIIPGMGFVISPAFTVPVIGQGAWIFMTKEKFLEEYDFFKKKFDESDAKKDIISDKEKTVNSLQAYGAQNFVNGYGHNKGDAVDGKIPFVNFPKNISHVILPNDIINSDFLSANRYKNNILKFNAATYFNSALTKGDIVAEKIFNDKEHGNDYYLLRNSYGGTGDYTYSVVLRYNYPRIYKADNSLGFKDTKNIGTDNVILGTSEKLSYEHELKRSDITDDERKELEEEYKSYIEDNNYAIQNATTFLNSDKWSAICPVTYIGNVDKDIKNIPYKTIKRNDDTLSKGETKIEVKGKDGEKITITTYEVNEKTGELKNPKTEEKITEAVDEVILVGTKEPDIFVPKEDNSKPEDVPANYKMIEFKVGEEGLIDIKSKSKVWVNPDKEIDLTSYTPKVTGKKGFTFTSWDKPLKAKFTEDTIINAVFKSDQKDNKKYPAIDPEKTAVENLEKLSDSEKAEVKDKVQKSNPNAKTVDIDDKGNATLTYEDKSVNTIPADKTVYKKDTEIKDNEKYHANKPKKKVEVINKEKLTSEEKTKVEEEVKKANPEAKTIEVKDNGDVVITYPDDSTNELKQEDTVIEKKPEDTRKDNEKYPTIKPDKKVGIKDIDNLTYAEKDKVKEEVEKVNPHAKKFEVKDNGDVVITYPDGSTNELKQKDTVYEIKKSREPYVDKVHEGDEYITGKGEEYSYIEITLSNKRIINGKTDRYGEFKIKTPYKLYKDDVIYVNQTEFDKDPSDDVAVRVLAEREDKVKDKLKAADHYAYIVGYPDSTFRPNNIITRAEVTEIFARLSKKQVRSTRFSFSDVKPNDWFYNAVQIGLEEGFIKGYLDGTFRPSEPMTRAEFASIISTYASQEAKRQKFSDVKGWSTGVVDTAYVNGWMKGYSDNLFRPNSYISRAEAISVINRMLNRRPDKDFIAKELLKSSRGSRIFTDVNVYDWYFYDIYAATWGHDYEIKDGVEKWTRLNGKTFMVR